MGMQSRYGEYSIVITRLGLIIDHLIEVSKKYPTVFNRDQFMEITGLGQSSTADKLKDFELYGLVHRNKNRKNRTYTISKLGQAIIRGGDERTSAIDTVVKSVPLWDQLLKTIGKKPNKTAFANAFKQITKVDDKILSENIGRLWYAYTDDISCMTKSPPFSKWSSVFRETRIPARVLGPSIKHVTPQKEEMAEIPEPTEKTQASEPTTQSLEKEKNVETTEERLPRLPSKYGVIEYKGHRFDIKDELSYGFAEHMMKRIKKDLEHELGVQFES